MIYFTVEYDVEDILGVIDAFLEHDQMHLPDDPGAAENTPQPAEILSIIDLDIDKIRLNPKQPRKFIDNERLGELADSIRQNGIIEPVIVRKVGDDSFELVAGERRFRAAVQVGLHNIPAVARVLNDLQTLEIALIENIQREDISPLECAEAYHRLIDEFHLTQEEISDRVGKKRSTVANTLRLLNLPQCIQDSLAICDISEGHARALLSIDDQERQLEVWRIVIKDGLSVREAERLSRQPKTSKTDNVSRATGRHGQLDPHIVDVEDKLRRYLGTKVSINSVKGESGRIEIDFYDMEDFMRILELISDVSSCQ